MRPSLAERSTALKEVINEIEDGYGDEIEKVNRYTNSITPSKTRVKFCSRNSTPKVSF